jgi:hypothetical protein
MPWLVHIDQSNDLHGSPRGTVRAGLNVTALAADASEKTMTIA